MANVRNDTISIDFDHFVHIELFLPRYKTEYHLVFIPPHPPPPSSPPPPFSSSFLSPFTAFTFSGQSAYSSVFGGEAPFCFFYVLCKSPLRTVRTDCMNNAWQR